jgi:putative MFS transporter
MTSIFLSRSDAILVRLEQMPFTRFHMRLRLIVGAATFFDLFDAIMIAFVAPALIRPWSLSPPQIGLLISAAYVGQFVGALFFGWLAGRIGRRRTILLTTGCYGIGSLLVAGACNFNSMLVLRALQGIGLGGEVPVAAAYLSEWIAAESRGRYVAFFELTAPLGMSCGVALRSRSACTSRSAPRRRSSWFSIVIHEAAQARHLIGGRGSFASPGSMT